MIQTQRVAIGSIGAVGMALARKLCAGVDGLKLVAVSAANTETAMQRISTLDSEIELVPAADLARYADIVVECAPAALFREIAEPTLRAGRILVPISVGALLVNTDLKDLASANGTHIRVPSGAILGLDAIKAAAEGEIHRVQMVTRKPPGGLMGAPYLEQQGIDLSQIKQAERIFKGTATEGAKGFPANVNVAAAVGLAGIGPDRTELEIWADPSIERNIHTIRVESDSANLDLKIESIPSEENPRSGKIVALSILSTLKSLILPLRVGT
jgi:aspartate dehydrogenase